MNMSRLKGFFQRSLIKKIALASIIGILIGILGLWLDSSSLPIGVIFGFVSYQLADWFLSTESERKARINSITAHFHGIRRHSVAIPLYMAMSTYFFLSYSKPHEGAVKQIFFFFQFFGLVAIFAVGAFNAVLALRSSLNLFPQMAHQFMKGILFYSMALWLIGYCGDDLYKWAVAYPAEAVATLCALAIIWMSIDFMLFPQMAHQFMKGILFYSMALWLIGYCGDDLYKWAMAYPAEAVANLCALAIIWMTIDFMRGKLFTQLKILKNETIAVAPKKLSTQDIQHIAAHESGHALVYAALGHLPADIKMVINSKSDNHGHLGFITGIQNGHALCRKSFTEWEMLVYLAGKLGDSLMYDDPVLGSGEDYRRWLALARGYLANHCNGIYYAEPVNRLEQQSNDGKLEELHTGQLALLHELFSLNTAVFRELNSALIEKRVMYHDDLVPFMKQVKIPPGFPLPFGPFKEFSSQPPDGLMA